MSQRIALHTRGGAGHKDRRIYALYHGDNNLCDGTIDDIATVRRVKRETIQWLKTPSGMKRNGKTGLALVLIGSEA